MNILIACDPLRPNFVVNTFVKNDPIIPPTAKMPTWNAKLESKYFWSKSCGKNGNILILFEKQVFVSKNRQIKQFTRSNNSVNQCIRWIWNFGEKSTYRILSSVNLSNSINSWENETSGIPWKIFSSWKKNRNSVGYNLLSISPCDDWWFLKWTIVASSYPIVQFASTVLHCSQS